MTLRQKSGGGATARPNRPNNETKKGTPSNRGSLFNLLRPASGTARPSGLRGALDGIAEWFRSVLSELRKVTWPSREVTRNLTIIVIAVSGAVGALLGATDYLFKLLFEQLLR